MVDRHTYDKCWYANLYINQTIYTNTIHMSAHNSRTRMFPEESDNAIYGNDVS